MKTEELIKELLDVTLRNRKEVESLKKLSTENLNSKISKQSWSILECIEHLNRYGDFYIPEIKEKISKSKYKETEVFKSGMLGNYFAMSMLPKEKLNKMKTFTSMNPINIVLEREVLDKFIEQQIQIINLLNLAKTVDLNRVKTSISISKWIKLKLGDTLRVLIYHNWRHMVQVEKVIRSLT